jgi:hypothetical protein
MANTDEIQDLEAAIKQLPGVLGCVVLHTPDGRPSEIQAFTQVGTDRDAIQSRILEEVAGRDFGEQMSQIYVFELEEESYFGDLEALERAVEYAEQEARTQGPRKLPDEQVAPAAGMGPTVSLGKRPRVRRVALSSSSWTSEAVVALGEEGNEVVGQATAEKTPHGLKVLAEATLEAATKLTGGGTEFKVKSASLVNVGGQEAVLVLVLEDGADMLGAALTRGGPLTEATVRATLDAINRRLAK